MQCKRYDDFMREYQYYRSFLWKYRKTKKPFTDYYFHPKLKIEETKVNLGPDKIEWKRIDDVFKAPLFDPKLINIDYIKQGKLGDCYLIAAFLRIGRQPELITKLFDKTADTVLGRVNNSINIKCGAVVIFFHAFGRETPVLIDTLIPFKKGTKQPAFSYPVNTQVSPWFLLVEKAYAKLFGSYSNVSGGNFSKTIYTLYGYQPHGKSIRELIEKEKTTKKTVFQRILEYQSQGAVMATGISKNDRTKEELKPVGLVVSHAYLLLKAIDYKGKHFLNLRNPWGYHEWKGDWSDDSPLWTNEYREALNYKNTTGNGSFWMIEKDYLNYFTSLSLSRPIPTDWHSKAFTIEMCPGDSDGCPSDSLEAHLEEQPNYALKIIEKVPPSEKVTLYILIEKRSYFPDEVKFVDHDKRTKYQFLLVYSKGQKLTQTVYKSSSKIKINLEKSLDWFNCKLDFPNEVLTIALQRTEKSDFYDECSIRVTCRYDFELYEIDKPSEKVEDNENLGKLFSTVTGVHKILSRSRNNRKIKDDELVKKKPKKLKHFRPKCIKISNSSDDEKDDNDYKGPNKGSNELNKNDNDNDDDINDIDDDDDIHLTKEDVVRLKKKEESLKKERFDIQSEVNELADQQAKLQDEINQIADKLEKEKDMKDLEQLNRKIEEKRNEMEGLENRIISMLERIDEKDDEINKTLKISQQRARKKKS